MIVKKIKKNKILSTKLQRNKGFVLLFVVMLSSIILAITLGVVDISLKEIKFGTSAKDTNEAFFAADTGAECALYYDRSASGNNAFTGTASMNCAGSNITLNGSDPSWNFVVSGLGSEGKGCAKVTVDKTGLAPCNSPVCIISKGYSTGDVSCNSIDPNRVERQLELNY